MHCKDHGVVSLESHVPAGDSSSGDQKGSHLRGTAGREVLFGHEVQSPLLQNGDNDCIYFMCFNENKYFKVFREVPETTGWLWVLAIIMAIITFK